MERSSELPIGDHEVRAIKGSIGSMDFSELSWRCGSTPPPTGSLIADAGSKFGDCSRLAKG
jgi:hypothetical protein